MSKGGESGGKDFWDKLQASGSVFVGVAVALIGGWYNLQQDSLQRETLVQQTYTEIVAQREKSDNDIRAQMFQRLVESLFGKLEVLPTTFGPAAVAGEAAAGMDPAAQDPERELFSAPSVDERLAHYRKRIMFLNLLVHNFETVDIKPLFNQLDSELSVLAEGVLQKTGQKNCYALREELRRIGSYVAVRQANALAAAEDAKVRRFEFRLKKKEKDGAIESTIEAISLDNGGTEIPVELVARDLDDGRVRVSIAPAWLPGDKVDNFATVRDPDFYVTFYDAPYIDNVRLTSGMRVAVILNRSIPVEKLLLHPDWVAEDHETRELLKFYADEGVANVAEVTLIQFPDEYTALRDRPYVEKIFEDLKLREARDE
jgi:hypothetical protein